MIESPIARTSDPHTSHERVIDHSLIDQNALLVEIWHRWDTRSGDETTDGWFTDDDVAEWINRPRNIAAKVRLRLEAKGLVARLVPEGDQEVVKTNTLGQVVMAFRPTKR